MQVRNVTGGMVSWAEVVCDDGPPGHRGLKIGPMEIITIETPSLGDRSYEPAAVIAWAVGGKIRTYRTVPFADLAEHSVQPCSCPAGRTPRRRVC